MKEFIGNGSIKILHKILMENNFKNVFFITGKSTLTQKNIKKVLGLIEKKCQLFHYDEISPTPTVKGVNRVLNSFNKGNFDLIVAMGGGSALDIGKSLAVFSKNEGNVKDFLLKKKKIQYQPTPLILIPTTAGTGSEVTHFAVIFDGYTKYSLADEKYIHADYAIIDPELTYTLPKRITAYTGMDALSQGIESYWNVNSTEKSKEYASKAIKLVMENIIKAVHGPDKNSRYNMAIAANYAGKAINITKTTACHAISYPITSYFKVPHGHAVVLTLPSMIVFNSEVNENDVLDSRGFDYVKNIMADLTTLLGAKSFLEAKEKLNDILKRIGLETKLSDLGVSTQEEIEIIIKNGFNPERVKNNPRLLTENQLKNIINEIR
ncbi:MAG: phosphonoacetaldehyde reductase [Candidatus Lokiarchaeota archaeon]|nr:phosphonoacetaldehyde reductase [Candidatus Lokiarchaeota archaeon]